MSADAASRPMQTVTFAQIEAIPGMIAALKEIATKDGHPWMYQRIAREALAKAGEQP